MFALRTTSGDPKEPTRLLVGLGRGHFVAVTDKRILRWSGETTPSTSMKRRDKGPCCVSDDGRFAAVVTENEDGGVGLAIYRLEERRRLMIDYLEEGASMHGFLPGSTRLVICPGSPNGGAIVSTMALLDVAEVTDDDLDAPLTAFPGETEGYVFPISDAAGRRLVAAYSEGSLVVWDVATRAAVVALQGDVPADLGDEPPSVPFADCPEAVACSRDGHRVVSVHFGSRTTVQVWDVDGATKRLRLSLADSQPDAKVDLRGSLSLHPDGTHLLHVDGDEVACYDLDALASRHGVTDEPVQPAPSDRVRTWRVGGRVPFASFLRDGRHVVTIDGDRMRLWSMERDAVVAEWRAPGAITAWAIARDGSMAVADAGGGLSVGALEGYVGSEAIDSAAFGWAQASDT